MTKKFALNRRATVKYALYSFLIASISYSFASAQTFTYLKGQDGKPSPEAELAAMCVKLGIQIPQDATPPELLKIAFEAAKGKPLPQDSLHAYYVGDTFTNLSREVLVNDPYGGRLLSHQGEPSFLLALDGSKVYDTSIDRDTLRNTLSLKSAPDYIKNWVISQWWTQETGKKWSDLETTTTGSTYRITYNNSDTIRYDELRQFGPYIIGLEIQQGNVEDGKSGFKIAQFIDHYSFFYKRVDDFSFLRRQIPSVIKKKRLLPPPSSNNWE